MEKFIDQFKAFLYGAIIYFQMDKDVTIILLALISIDMLFGAIKAATLDSMQFELVAFWRGLIKKVLMLTSIMVLALIAKGLGFEDFRLLVLNVMKIMILAEGISIITSIRSIWDRKEYKSNDFISVLLGKVGDFLAKWIDKLIRAFDDKTSCL